MEGLNELKAFVFTAYIGEFAKPIVYACTLSAGVLAFISLTKEIYRKAISSNFRLSSLEKIFNSFK